MVSLRFGSSLAAWTRPAPAPASASTAAVDVDSDATATSSSSIAMRAVADALQARRRGSALEPRSSSSMMSHLLASCRRASLQDTTSSMASKTQIAAHCAAWMRSSIASRASTCPDANDLPSPTSRSMLDRAISADTADASTSASRTSLSTSMPPTTTKDKAQTQTQRQRQLKAKSISAPSRATCSTVLRDSLSSSPLDLELLREDAEYSDYLRAFATGSHLMMDNVVFYEVHVQLSQSTWTIQRRFSEFYQLRQHLLKHFAKRPRQRQAPRCAICASLHQALEQAVFPSRTPLMFRGYADHAMHLDPHGARGEARIAARKLQLHAFVQTCMEVLRGLCQHARVLCDSSACELPLALRVLEEFFELSFARYMRFLSERGVMATRPQPRLSLPTTTAEPSATTSTSTFASATSASQHTRVAMAAPTQAC